MRNYAEYFNAVDVVCGECYGTEVDCEKCPVRKCCDEHMNDYRDEMEEE